MMNAATRYVFKNMMNDYQFGMLERVVSVLDSCKTLDQVMVALEYSRLARLKAGFSWDLTGQFTEKFNEIKSQ